MGLILFFTIYDPAQTVHNYKCRVIHTYQGHDLMNKGTMLVVQDLENKNYKFKWLIGENKPWVCEIGDTITIKELPLEYLRGVQ